MLQRYSRSCSAESSTTCSARRANRDESLRNPNMLKRGPVHIHVHVLAASTNHMTREKAEYQIITTTHNARQTSTVLTKITSPRTPYYPKILHSPIQASHVPTVATYTTGAVSLGTALVLPLFIQ